MAVLKYRVLTGPETIKTLLETYHIKHMRLVGSYARDDQTTDSDIDLLVEEEKDAPLECRGWNEVWVYSWLTSLLWRDDIDVFEKKTVLPEIEQTLLSDMLQIW